MAYKIPANFREQAREQSGTSILDSGGAYGYQWQLPPIPADFPLEYASGGSYPMLMRSCAQLLDQCFSIDERETRKFQRWALMGSNRNLSWFECSRNYIAKMIEKRADGWYKDNGDAPMFINTYNEETDLDQDVEIHAPGLYVDYAMIMMHTGCDARGGYAEPVVARGRDDGLEEFLCGLRVSPWCQHCDASEETMYYAEKRGWRLRSRTHSVSLICGACGKVALNYPIPGSREKKAA